MDKINKILEKIKKEYSESRVHDDVDNMKGEYVWDWEDEFDSLEEAYEEQGRCEAETAVLNNIINSIEESLTIDEKEIIFNSLSEYYYLNIY